jgi:hypothetical protein
MQRCWCTPPTNHTPDTTHTCIWDNPHYDIDAPDRNKVVYITGDEIFRALGKPRLAVFVEPNWVHNICTKFIGTPELTPNTITLPNGLIEFLFNLFKRANNCTLHRNK